MEDFMNEFEKKVEYYRQKKAKNISLAVMLYILSVVVLLSFVCFWGAAILGVISMLTMIAVATGIIVFTVLSIPKDVLHALSENEYSEIIEEKDGTKLIYKSSCGRSASVIEKSILNLYWLVVTIIYLGVSFSSGAWHITWLIWLIATAIEQALKIIFTLKDGNLNNYKRVEDNSNQ